MRIAVDTINKFAVGGAANGTIVVVRGAIAGHSGIVSMAFVPITRRRACRGAFRTVTGRRDEFQQLLDAIVAL